MIKKTLLISLLLFATSCSLIKPAASERNQKWSNFFDVDKQKRLLFLDALADLKTGKSRPSADHLNSAEKKFQFLANEYQDDGASKQLEKIENFKNDYRKYYSDLAANAMKKKLIFTSAGYYRSIQRVFPNDEAAASFFAKYETEVPKRLQRNLEAGNTYIKKKKLSSAKRSFNRVLTYDPNNKKAQQGLAKVNRIKKQNRIKAKQAKIAKLTKKKKKNKPNIADKAADPVPAVIEEIPLTAAEKARLYSNGIKAYEKKDYLKAYELFEAIEDTTYKDTELYFNRSQDKIDALGLSDEN